MKTYELGEAGLAFLKSLLEGGDHLARAVQRESLSQGRLFTFLPDLADPVKVSLVEGGLSSFISDWKPDWPIEQITADHLRESNSIFVMELKSTTREAALRLYAGETFQFFISTPSHHTFVDAHGLPVQEETAGVYGYVRSADEDLENIRNLILDHRPFGAIGVLSSIGADELPFNGDECNSAIFLELAANTKYIIGSAYDDEGWIVWARNPFSESFKTEGKIF